MFGTLILEQDPMTLADVPLGVLQWVQVVGWFGFLGAFFWLLGGYLPMRATEKARIPDWQRTLFLSTFGIALLAYLVVLGIYIWLSAMSIIRGGNFQPPMAVLTALFICLTVGGVASLVAVGLPFLLNLGSLRSRRIWGLAKLSFKEALRRRVLYAFAGLLLVFLFGSWFIPHKPSDQVRTYVQVVYFAMSALLLLAAAVLAAFSIPADIRSQTIHTIVTKPVERFEIFLGRFLGFTALMTLVLVAMTALSLLYVVRGVDPAAAAESLKARVPIYGDLAFVNTSDPRKGENVGREWAYRSYISGPMPGRREGELPQAIWTIGPVPASLGQRKSVKCEITFDIYRTTTGFHDKGAACKFVFQSWRFKEGGGLDRDSDMPAYRAALQDALKNRGAKTEEQVRADLAAEYGIWEYPSKPVFDYQTLDLDVPAGLFAHAATDDPKRRAEVLAAGGKPDSVIVKVTCLENSQYVGMAKHDLYLRADDPDSGNDGLLFGWNFFKGSFGLWLTLTLVIGLAVALSTYLSGVIALLVTLLLFMGGLFQDFIRQVALGQNPGGGPAESLLRLVKGQLNTGPMDESTAQRVAQGSDFVFRGIVGRILDVIPDVDRFNMTNFVAEGFNINGGLLLLNTLVLFGYLLPWAVLAYYLLKWREVAGPT